MTRISSAAAQKLALDIFTRCGAPAEEAKLVADHLVDANLCGVDSHGLMRIPQYVGDVRAGAVEPGAKIEITQETPVSAVVDCGWNFGLVGAARTVEIALEKARSSRIAIVVTRRCNHAGRLGYSMEKIAQEGFWGMGFCSSGRHGHFVVPWNGREGRLATNPIAYGVPVPGQPPIVADFSTAQAPEGKIRIYKNRGQELPEGWIIDAEGKPSTSPADFYGPPQGGILPFGGTLGYRGFSLGLLVELMGTILAGHDTTEARPGNGLAFLLFDPTILAEPEALRQHLLSLCEYVQSSAPARSDLEVLLPGEPERRSRARKLVDGIEIEDTTWSAILTAATSLGVSGSTTQVRLKHERLFSRIQTLKRRDFLKTSVLGVASTGATAAMGSYLPEDAARSSKAADHQQGPIDPGKVYSSEPHRLFPKDLPTKQWARFESAGFSQPACGIVYRREDVVPHGMPLGGVATGHMDVDTDGTFGYFNLFNSAVPTRGPIQHGFLGISSGDRCWVLITRDMTGTENASDIEYWGHYPIADLEYDLSGPFQVGLRAWSPFIPGDSRVSNTPASVFEVHVRNRSNEQHKVTLGFSFPGPTQAEAQISPTSDRQLRYINDSFPLSEPVASGIVPAIREEVTTGSFHGQLIRSPLGTEYAIGFLDDLPARFGGALWIYGYDYATGQQWANMQEHLPPVGEGDFSASLATDFQLNPGEEKVVRVLVAWYSPIWKGERTNTFARMYTSQYKGAKDVAAFVGSNHASLLRRVIAWQEAVYSADEYPVWLREGLVNILHLIPKTAYWAVAQEPLGKWCRPEDGLYGMSESPRECPQIECIPCSFYGNVPVVYFFPDLALSTLRGYKAYQYANGAPPWIFGGCTGFAAEGYTATDPCDMATPSPGYQSTLNGPCYVDMFDRYWLRTGNDEILKEFYPSIKKAVAYTIQLRPGPEGIVSVPTGNRNPTQPHAPPGGGLDWFEGNGWFGMTPHVGGIHLAMLRMAQRMAEHMEDDAFARQCKAWIAQGSEQMESKLWAGDYYLAYYEPETEKKSDLVFGYQLDGDWMAKYHGLPAVFQTDRAEMALKKIKQTCVAINRYGAANFARPSALPASPKDFAAWGAGYGAHGYFPPEVYMLGATYMYAGDKETGSEIIRTCQEGISAKYGYTWTQPNIVSGDTGRRIYGSDYYQNMMLWIVPAALDGEDIQKALAGGRLISRVLSAGRPA